MHPVRVFPQENSGCKGKRESTQGDHHVVHKEQPEGPSNPSRSKALFPASNAFDFLNDLFDHPVGGGCTGRHSDDFHVCELGLVQFLFGLDVKGGKSGGLGDQGKTPGVAAVISADHHHAVHMPGKAAHLFLPSVRGITDGIKNLGLRHFLFNRFLNFPIVFSILCGLGDHEKLFNLRQIGHLLGAPDHVDVSLGIPHETDHLGVISVTHDHGGISLSSVRTDDGLYLGHSGTGGIYDPQSAGAKDFTIQGRDTMGPDDHGALLDAGNILDGNDTFRLEEIDDLLVMDEGAEGINGAFAPVGLGEDHVHGPMHPHTKSGRSCQFYFQFFSSVKSEK